MVEDIQAAIPWGVLLSFMVGPVFFILLETSVIKGFRAALVFDLGVIFADILFLLIAYFSSYQLLDNISNGPGLYVFGGMILLVYGLIILLRRNRAKKVNYDEVADIVVKRTNYLGLFVKGFLLNFINVGVLVFWLGVLLIFSPSLNNDPKRITIFFGTMLSTYLLVDMLKIILAKQLKSKLTEERIILIKKVIGIILIICGVFLIVKGFLPKDQLNIQDRIEEMREQQKDRMEAPSGFEPL